MLPASAVTHRYVRDVRCSGAPVLHWEDTDDGDVDEMLYDSNDANMNVTALVDTGGDVVERWLYDPYGRPTSLHGADDADGAVTEWGVDAQHDRFTRFLYAGYHRGWEADFYHVRHRTYHPTLGRWLSRDPLDRAGDVNRYEYSGSSPASQLDPMGLFVTNMISQIAEEIADVGEAAAIAWHWVKGNGHAPFVREGGAWGQWARSKAAIRTAARNLMTSAAERAWADYASGPASYAGDYREANARVYLDGSFAQILSLNRVAYSITGGFAVYYQNCEVVLAETEHRIEDYADAHWEAIFPDLPMILYQQTGRILPERFEPFQWFPVEISWYDEEEIIFNFSGGAVQARGGWPFESEAWQPISE
jgi:RHS repeat-associated protein